METVKHKDKILNSGSAAGGKEHLIPTSCFVCLVPLHVLKATFPHLNRPRSAS